MAINQKDLEDGIKSAFGNTPQTQQAFLNSIRGGEGLLNLADMQQKIIGEIQDKQLKANQGSSPFSANDFFPNLINRIQMQIIPYTRTINSVFTKYGSRGMVDVGDGYEVIGTNPRDALLHDLENFVPKNTDKMNMYNAFYTTNYQAKTTTWWFMSAISKATPTLNNLASILTKIMKTLNDEIEFVRYYLEPKVVKGIKNIIDISTKTNIEDVLKEIYKTILDQYYPNDNFNISKDGVKQSDGTMFKSLNMTPSLNDYVMLVPSSFLNLWTTEISAKFYNQIYMSPTNWGDVILFGLDKEQPEQKSVTNKELAKKSPALPNHIAVIQKDAFLEFIKAENSTSQVWLEGQTAYTLWQWGCIDLIEFYNGALFKHGELKPTPNRLSIVSNDKNPIYGKMVS